MSGAEITVFLMLSACLLLIVYSRSAGTFLDRLLSGLIEKKRSGKSTNQQNK